MKSLKECWEKSPYHSLKWNHYFDIYEKFLHKYIDKEVTLVEVGIYQGGSLFMRKDYLGEKARIIGIEANEDAKYFEKYGFEIFIGDQSDENFWNSFWKKVGDVDVIIDDGAHKFCHQIMTCENSLDHIKEDGFVIVEDIHTNYYDNTNDFWGRQDCRFIDYCKNMIDGINHRSKFVKYGVKNDKNLKHEDKVHSISFFDSMVVMNVNKQKSLISNDVKNRGKKISLGNFENKKEIDWNIFHEKYMRKYKNV